MKRQARWAAVLVGVCAVAGAFWIGPDAATERLNVLPRGLPGLALAAKPAAESEPTVIRFSRGDWDPTGWKPVRLANQQQPRTFTQLDTALGTTGQTFTDEEYRREADNAVLVHDLGTAEVEVEVDFSIGKGFNGSSAPGLCLAPRIKDGVLQSSIAVFVADYALAAWYQDTAPDDKAVRYRHLLQLARWTDPARPHTLRCRLSKKEAAVAIRVDNSDVAVLSFVGNPALSFVPQEVNGVVGLWGCHGECTFRQMRVRRPGTLPFLVRKPGPQRPD